MCMVCFHLLVAFIIEIFSVYVLVSPVNQYQLIKNVMVMMNVSISRYELGWSAQNSWECLGITGKIPGTGRDGNGVSNGISPGNNELQRGMAGVPAGLPQPSPHGPRGQSRLGPCGVPCGSRRRWLAGEAIKIVIKLCLLRFTYNDFIYRPLFIYIVRPIFHGLL